MAFFDRIFGKGRQAAAARTAELRGDLTIRVAESCQSRYLSLLGRELISGVSGSRCGTTRPTL